MGKDYDRYISPQNTRRIKQKKCLYLSVAGVFALTCLLIALCRSDNRVLGLVGVFWSALVSVAQLLDRRKEHWTWGYITLLCIIFFSGAIAMILASGIYWCLILWVAETVVCVALYITDHRKTKAGRK